MLLYIIQYVLYVNIKSKFLTVMNKLSYFESMSEILTNKKVKILLPVHLLSSSRWLRSLSKGLV